MAYDEELAERIRKVLGGKRKGITEMKMFGGLGFLMNGNMFAGIMSKGDLMVRVANEDHDAAIKKPNARAFDFTGKRMKGFVLVDPKGLAKDSVLAAWIEMGETYVATLPPKAKKKKAGAGSKKKPASKK